MHHHALVGSLLGLLGTAPMGLADDRPPNLIIILADDLGYADVGFQGCRDVPTPNIDALARGGVRCTNGYVSHPFCSPTRAGLMTGRYQQRFGHENNPVYAPNDPRIGLPVDQLTIAEVLRSAGYATGAIGKWHLGAEPRYVPNERGFQEYFGLIGGGHQYFESREGSTAEYLIPIVRDREPVPFPGYLTDAFSSEAVSFIDRHADRPFFLYLAYNAVHTPMQAPPERIARFEAIEDPKRRTYAAMLDAMDEGIGQVLDALQRHNLERDTLIVFLSDNGGPPTANASRNDPLRGAKGTLFEGGIRVPFVVRWPSKLAVGSTYDQPVCSIDLLPTFAAAAGAKVPERVDLDGVNLVPHLRGESAQPPHEALFWRADGGARYAVRQGDFKLVQDREGGPMLFNLARDLSETRDLAAEQPERVAALKARYDNWNARNVAPLWSNPPGAAKKQPAKKAQAKGKAKSKVTEPIKD
jgi:arylsulfatase A-like enzyme